LLPPGSPCRHPHIIDCCQVHLSHPKFSLELEGLSVKGLIPKSLHKDPPVVCGNDGLMEGVEGSGVTPEGSSEPGREGLKCPVIIIWLCIELGDMSIMLAHCHGHNTCQLSIIQLLDIASNLLPSHCRDCEVGKSSVVRLEPCGAFERLSSNGIKLCLELEPLLVCCVEGLLDAMLTILVELVPLLYCGK
jgi:hypothetical protein